MPKVQSLDELCKGVLSVSVNWDNLFELRYLSREDSSAKQQYESLLRTMVTLKTLSFESSGNYIIQIPRCDGGGIGNPKLDDKTLYVINYADAKKINEKFPNSIILGYQ